MIDSNEQIGQNSNPNIGGIFIPAVKRDHPCLVQMHAIEIFDLLTDTLPFRCGTFDEKGD